jgi:sulfide:quinone oxidoreductase
MSAREDTRQKLRVLIAGSGVAGLETALALADLAGARVQTTVLAQDDEFVYRPLTVGEPFSYAAARRYPLGQIVGDGGAELLLGTLGWVDRAGQSAHTTHGRALPYDALVLAVGARIAQRYRHALTIDDRTLESSLHGLVEDLELGYIESIAFVAPGRMAWPLPLYELALLTAGRAYEMNVPLRVTLVTPEDTPLAIFGVNASARVAELLEQAGIETITSAYAEIPEAGQIALHPQQREVHADRIVALPELYGPAVRGLPLSPEGFIRVDRFARVPDCGPVFAAGDATDFAVKHGGIAAQQADLVAESLAKLAGADVEPEPFHPVLRGMLLTVEKPYYMCARITGGHGFDSEFSPEPLWSPPNKIAARYLAPYLASHDGHASVA